MYKLPTKTWHLNRLIFLIAGLFIVSSLALGFFLSPLFYIFTGLVGTMQIIYALTGYCPMAILLDHLGVSLLILAVIPSLAACSAEAQDQTFEVNVFEVNQEVVPNTLEFSSLIDGGAESSLSAEASGELKEIYVDIGDKVSAGQVLASTSGEFERFSYETASMAYENETRNYANMQSLMDAYVKQAESTLNIAKVSLGAAESALGSEEDVVGSQLDQAYLSLEYAQIQKNNLVSIYDQNRSSLLAALQSSVTQMLILEKDSISYIYSINELRFGESHSKFELDSKFSSVSGTTSTFERNVNNFANSFVNFEDYYDLNISLAGEDEILLMDLANQSLDLAKTLKDRIQDMHDIVVHSLSTASISQSELDNYKTQLSTYGSRLESTIISQSNGDLVGIEGILKSLESAETQYNAGISDLDKQIEIANQKIDLLENNSSSSIDKYSSNLDLSKAQNDQALIAFESAKTDRDVKIQIAKSSLDAARGQMNIAKSLYDKTLIIAPYSGVVAKRYYDIGAFVGAGQSVFDIVDTANFKIVINVPGSYLELFSLGQEARIVASDGSEYSVPIPAKISKVQPILSDTSGKSEIELLASLDVTFIPGSYVDIEIDVDIDRTSIVVPEESLVSLYDQDFVYVIADGRASIREVERGGGFDGFVEILDGLTVGELVALDGTSNLADGDLVKIIDGK